MVRNTTMTAGILIAGIAPALACPDLAGTFECPARGSQTPMTMIVTMARGANQSATYTFTYVRAAGQTTLQVPASPQGAPPNNGRFGVCNGSELVVKKEGDAGEGTRNFINAAGHFEAVSAGQTQITCARKPR